MQIVKPFDGPYGASVRASVEPIKPTIVAAMELLCSFCLYSLSPVERIHDPVGTCRNGLY